MSRSVLGTAQKSVVDIGSAVLRHVSSEGCQLVSAEARPKVGQRLRFKIGAARQVMGTVRWSVGDRAGFEFDEPISARSVASWMRRPADLLAVRLYRA